MKKNRFLRVLLVLLVLAFLLLAGTWAVGLWSEDGGGSGYGERLF